MNPSDYAPVVVLSKPMLNLRIWWYNMVF